MAICPVQFQKFYTIWFGHLAIFMNLSAYSLDLLLNCLQRWSLQIIYLESLGNLEESGFNECKMTEDIRTHQSFKYENYKIQIDILSKDRGGKFVLDSPLILLITVSNIALSGEIRKSLFQEEVLG